MLAAGSLEACAPCRNCSAPSQAPWGVTCNLYGVASGTLISPASPVLSSGWRASTDALRSGVGTRVGLRRSLRDRGLGGGDGVARDSGFVRRGRKLYRDWVLLPELELSVVTISVAFRRGRDGRERG